MAANVDAAAAPFEPKNVFITGGAGFIASHVVMLLVSEETPFDWSISKRCRRICLEPD